MSPPVDAAVASTVTRIERAAGPEALRAIFAELVDDVGADAAARIWWAAFAASDAAET